MINANILSSNLLMIANHIHKEPSYFRIKKEKDGTESIQKNSRCHRLWIYCFGSSYAKKIQEVIEHNRHLASKLKRCYFIDEKTQEPTRLYVAVQKYNQTIEASQRHPLFHSKALANHIRLELVQHAQLAELNPAKPVAITKIEPSIDFQKDKPEIVKERRFFKTYAIRRYPNAPISHTKEGRQIFFNTQKERLLSGIGHILEGIGNLFNYRVMRFQKYHFRKRNETDEHIYAPFTAPFSLSKEPTSYWLGHASLFLSVPLTSSQGTIANFYIMIDPVEKDLQPLLYPRQTKMARPIKEMPAPHVYFLSHNHLDHFSKTTVKKIFSQQPIMIVPKGDANAYIKLAKELRINKTLIFEIDWWETKQIQFEKNGEHFQMKITATPARHWSGRGPFSGHESTFLGAVIQGYEKGDIYFAGDTARLNDDHLAKLKNHFNIRWSFQPGGPDEIRKEMESTHQASVDGLWVHFKIMVFKIYTEGMKKEEFLKQVLELKTIYMHTMTFKLGNVHLSDTKDSLENVVKALLHSNEKNSHLNLKSYETKVYDELCAIAHSFQFEEGKKLTFQEIGKLIQATVIVPKIGSRLGLETPKMKQLEKTYTHLN